MVETLKAIFITVAIIAMIILFYFTFWILVLVIVGFAIFKGIRLTSYLKEELKELDKV